jgi:superfamily II DNA or RNA helicase
MGQMTTYPPPQPFLPPASAIEGRAVLRPYQAEALEAIRRAYERGIRRLLLVLPVGGGKTHIAARIPELIGDPRLIYCAHRHELLDQTLAVFRRERPDRPVGIERRDHHPSPCELSVVASIQSLSRPNRLERYAADDWPAMVIDEAHRSVTDSYLIVFRHFRHLPGDSLPARTDGLLLGITGTPRRTDQVGLGHVYSEVVFTRTLRDLVEEGHLVPLRGYLRRGGADLEGIRVRTDDGERDFDPHALSRAVNTPKRNRLVVDGTRHLALVDGRPTLVFAADVAHGEALAALFRKAGVRAANVHGDMEPDVRREILGQFRRGQLQALVNCLLLVEGIDIPQVSAIVMARPTQSALLYAQCVGRATRLYAGKTDAIVIDFVDNTHKHAASLVSLPTLFGLPPRFDLKGAAAHAVIRQFEDVAAAFDTGLDADIVETIRSPQDIPRFFHEIDLLKIAGLPPRVSRLTEFAWQRMPDGTFAITIPRPRPAEALQNGNLVLAPQDGDASGQLEVVENAIGHFEIRRRASAGAPEKLAEHPDLETALQAADRQIRERYRDRLVLLSKRARWREESATDKQLRLLEALGQPIPRNKDGIVLTKGQAQLLIDRALVLRRVGRTAGFPTSPASTAPAPTLPPDPATTRQLRYLRILGVPTPLALTKKEAQRLINRAKAAKKVHG